MKIATPPPFAMAIVPSFVRCVRYRSGRAVAAELRALGLADDKIAAHVAGCDALVARSGCVILEFGQIATAAALRQHQSGLILFARLDLLLCPVPRDFRGDPYAPGAPHRIAKMRGAVRECAERTGSPAIEWTPLDDRYVLWSPR